MDPVRISSFRPARQHDRIQIRRGRPDGQPSIGLEEMKMLDLLYVLGTLALFIAIGFIGRAVEKL